MKNNAIGVFDSGLGGLTCIKKIVEILPNEDIIYFGDTARVPYGTRDKENIINYTKESVEFLLSFDVKIVVIACGTASSNAFLEIKKCYPNVKIIEVITPSCKAAFIDGCEKIGVIATSASIHSGAYENTLLGIDQNIKILCQECPMLVPLIENGYGQSSVLNFFLEEYLNNMKKQEIDTLILGCTHFSIIKESIGKYFENKVKLIDSGFETAKSVKKFLNQNNLFSDKKTKGNIKYYVSSICENFKKIGGVFLEKDISKNTKVVNINDFKRVIYD